MDEAFPYRDWDRADVLEHMPRDAATILDVGCSYGGFGAALKQARLDAEVWGLEPIEHVAAAAAERLDHVICGSFPEDAPSRTFDCVVFNDVLEHLVDPWSALEAVHDLVRPGGRLVASIPNVRHFTVLAPLVAKGDFTYRDAGILDRTHLRFFTRASIVDLFGATGWRIEALVRTQMTPTNRGKIPRALGLIGERGRDLLNRNFVVVAEEQAE